MHCNKYNTPTNCPQLLPDFDPDCKYSYKSVSHAGCRNWNKSTHHQISTSPTRPPPSVVEYHPVDHPALLHHDWQRYKGVFDHHNHKIHLEKTDNPPI